MVRTFVLDSGMEKRRVRHRGWNYSADTKTSRQTIMPVVHNTRGRAYKLEAEQAMAALEMLTRLGEGVEALLRTPPSPQGGLILPGRRPTPDDPYVWTYEGVLHWGDSVPREHCATVAERTDDVPPLLLSELRALVDG